MTSGSCGVRCYFKHIFVRSFWMMFSRATLQDICIDMVLSLRSCLLLSLWWDSAREQLPNSIVSHSFYMKISSPYNTSIRDLVLVKSCI